MDDTVSVLLQYPGGVQGSFTCSITSQLSNTVSVSGTKGMAQVRFDWSSQEGCHGSQPEEGPSCGCCSWMWTELTSPRPVAKEPILNHQAVGWGLDF